MERIQKFNELHAETQIWLITAETSHRLMPSHLLQLLRQLHPTNLFEKVTTQIFKQVDHIILIYETHFAVNLRELGLTIGAQVFVTETFSDLEITVEPTHHQQLFERLWALWQCIKLSGIHARRHHKVACTLWSRANQYGCFYLNELLVVKEIPNQNRHPMAQFQILSNRWSAQI